MKMKETHNKERKPVSEDQEYGDFEEISEGGEAQTTSAEAPVRVRMPRNNELIGIVIQRLGGNKMEVRATDGKTRNCRVPGRYKRTMWLRPGNFVLIEPWPDDNNKADVVFQYKPNHVSQLRKNGLLKDLQEGF